MLINQYQSSFTLLAIAKDFVIKIHLLKHHTKLLPKNNIINVIIYCVRNYNPCLFINLLEYISKNKKDRNNYINTILITVLYFHLI